MSDEAIQQVQVEILGRQFNIGTPAAEHSTLVQAVQMLNDKINAIQGTGRIVETDKIVIMAALNLTHDLLKLTVKDGLAVGDFERKIMSMVEACDKALAAEPPN
nr:cell division protein ZapA [Snodgrassella sp. CFCC 13594]